MEVQYDLMTFGIPTDLLPVSMNGDIDLARHRNFLQQRKKMEASTLLSKALALVEAPLFDDCNALDVCDGDQNPEAIIGGRRDRFSTTPMIASNKMHNNANNSFHQSQLEYHQDNGYMNSNMNKMQSSFNDPYCFGNRNAMQVQASMQQQYELQHAMQSRR